MLNLALVGLLAGSLLNVSPGGGDDDKKAKKDTADTQESVIIVGDDVSNVQPITSDTYALGRVASEAPIKIWASYGWGEAQEVYDPSGNSIELNGAQIDLDGPGPFPSQASYTSADIVSQRVIFGAEINPLSFSKFQLGVGAQLSLAKNDLQFGADNRFARRPGATGMPDGDPIVIGENNALSSDFSVQNIKIYGSARGKVLGIHGGYILDLGDELTTTDSGLPADLPRSDQRDAIQLGVDFDYPITNFRLFGGIDYFQILEDESFPASTDGNSNVFGEEGDGIFNFVLGGGFRVSFFEIGAAAQIVARERQPVERNEIRTIGTSPNIGGYVSTISPYVKISPPSLPASIYIQGGVLDEYNTYGYAVDGANGPKPTFGFTAGIAIGFE